MKEISMHILDIVMNSLNAMATLIEIYIEESFKKNKLEIIIKDNGVGMSDEMVKLVFDPFFTTRKTRKVGFGIPTLKEACERCNGYLKINSILGKGTEVDFCFEKDNIDRAPLGNMGDTIMTIVNALECCELLYNHKTDTSSFIFDTREVKNVLMNVDIKDNTVMTWIRDYINENVTSISNI